VESRLEAWIDELALAAQGLPWKAIGAAFGVRRKARAPLRRAPFHPQGAPPLGPFHPYRSRAAIAARSASKISSRAIDSPQGLTTL
jgi:hypothetical protein